MYNREFDNGSKANGTARFDVKDDNFLEYSEKGQLILSDGQVLKSSRQYYYEIHPREILIYFFESPKSLFEKIELQEIKGAWMGKAMHHCGNDLYCSEYHFWEDGTFEILHKVKGPKKNYISKTQFFKASL